MKLLLKFAFDGTKYCGYQVQDNAPTVQKAINDALREYFGFECDVVGCSRTDSGVHANEFYATVTKRGSSSLEIACPEEKFPLAIASFVPEDIVVLEAKTVCDDFHARYDVKYKEYIYKILNTPLQNPFLRDYSYHFPKTVTDEMLEKLNEAASHMVGKHDFTSFMAQGSKIVDATRTVKYAEMIRDGDVIIFRVAADGFLYNMVRIMVGTLISVASGKLEPSDITSIIDAKDRKAAGITAPPQGLYLNKVYYS